MAKFYMRKWGITSIALMIIIAFSVEAVYGMKNDPKDLKNQENLGVPQQRKRKNVRAPQKNFFELKKYKIQNENKYSFLRNEEKFNESILSEEYRQKFISLKPFAKRTLFIEALRFVEFKEFNNRIQINGVDSLFNVLNYFFLDDKEQILHTNVFTFTPLGSCPEKLFKKLQGALNLCAKEKGVRVSRREKLEELLQIIRNQKGFELGYFSLLPKVLRLEINKYIPGLLKVSRMFEEQINDQIHFVKMSGYVNNKQVRYFVNSRLNLHELNLVFTSGITLEGILVALKENKNITTLGANSSLREEDVERILDTYPQITSIDCNVVDNLSRSFVEKYAKEITGLNLDEHMDIELIKIPKKLQYAYISFPFEEAQYKRKYSIFKDFLKINKTIKILELWNNNTNNQKIKEMVEALKENIVFEELKLGGNKIDHQGVAYITELFETNPCLKVLNLDDACIDSEGLKIVAEALKTNKTLKELRLMWNGINDEKVKILTEALKENKALTKLDLRSNPICEEAQRNISQKLPHIKVMFSVTECYSFF